MAVSEARPPYSDTELAVTRRYVASRATRDHWHASEIELTDRQGRWLATVDHLQGQIDGLVGNSKTDMRDAAKLRLDVDNLRAALVASETEVRRLRYMPAPPTLLSTESIALSIARSRAEREEDVGPNTAFMLVLAIERLLGVHDWTDNMPVEVCHRCHSATPNPACPDCCPENPRHTAAQVTE